MSGLVKDTVGGFNDYLADRQRETPGARMSVTLFDTVLDKLHRNEPVETIPPLTTDRYRQGGMGNTALNDAVGATIVDVDTAGYAQTHKVLIVVMTDGEENSSTEWTSRKQLADLVKAKEAEGWKFVFFGAGVEAFAEGQSLNVPVARTIRYEATPAGTADSYRRLSRASSLYAVNRSNMPETDWTSALSEPNADS